MSELLIAWCRCRGQKAAEDAAARPQAYLPGKNTEDIKNMAPLVFMDVD